MFKKVRVKSKMSLKNFSLDINITLPQARVIGLFGDSGSGKTTLVKSFLEGKSELSINNEPLNFKDKTKGGIGYVFQGEQLFDHLNVYENLKFPSRYKDLDERYFSYICERLRINNLFERSIFSLSGGEKQRVAIARALTYKVRVLILDEPLIHLGLNMRKEILDIISELSKNEEVLVFLISHLEQEVSPYCDGFIYLKKGRITEFTSRE